MRDYRNDGGFSSMSRFKSLFNFAILVMLTVSLAVFAGGCGDDANDGSKTGEGAPPGARGSEDGGFAVEAGKQRDPKEVQQEKETFSNEPPPVQLQSGDRSDFKVDKPTVVIARSEKEVNSLIRKLGVKSKDVAPVDFRTRQAVLVQMPKEPRGTLMQILDVSVREGVIVVRAARIAPGKGCPRPDYRPNPFNFVETRLMKEQKTTLKIEEVPNGSC